jgi:hypothetical protein
MRLFLFSHHIGASVPIKAPGSRSGRNPVQDAPTGKLMWFLAPSLGLAMFVNPWFWWLVLASFVAMVVVGVAWNVRNDS